MTEEELNLKGRCLEIGRVAADKPTLIGSLAARSIATADGPTTEVSLRGKGLRITEEAEDSAEIESMPSRYVSVKNGNLYEVYKDGRTGEGLMRLRNLRNGSIVTLREGAINDSERFVLDSYA